MRVFVYEYLTAVGLGHKTGDPLHSMYREGRAMRDAVAADFRAIPGVEVVTLDGSNPDRERECFLEHLEGCDWCLLIAPEIGDELGRRAEWVLEAGVRLLGPSVGAIRFLSNKLAVAGYWRDCGVPTPETTDRVPGSDEAFPMVWKPADGAGSTATFLLTSPEDAERAKGLVAAGEYAGPMLLQPLVPGRAASVAFLCGPGGNVPLRPAFQHLTHDGRFRYRGGETPIPPALSARALDLGIRAVACVPGLLGYVGVDLVLGEGSDGSEDFAIEINPRLTTSYVGLRRLAGFNLAGAMLRIAQGEEPPVEVWKPGRVHFTAEGTVQLANEAPERATGT
jgi:predicted ATP-grasp superfamily ATP-dependent carboligase